MHGLEALVDFRLEDMDPPVRVVDPPVRDVQPSVRLVEPRAYLVLQLGDAVRVGLQPPS